MPLEMRDGIAIATLNNGKANCLDREMLETIGRIVDEAQSTNASALMLTGYDRFFSAGLDLVTLIAFDRDEMREHIRGFDATMHRLLTWPRPVFAAVNGHAIAGGCVLAMMADERMMAMGKLKTGLKEAQLGVGLPQLTVRTLREKLPASSFVPVALEGRLFSPEEALHLGIVDELVAPEDLADRAFQRCAELAAIPSVAWAQIKLERYATFPPEDEEATEAWLDTWFDRETQARIAATVAELSSK